MQHDTKLSSKLASDHSQLELQLSEPVASGRLLEKDNKIFINRLNEICGNYDRMNSDVSIIGLSRCLLL